MPSWATRGLYRYDVFGGEHNHFHPYADEHGRVAYTEAEFAGFYGPELGYDRFCDAPDAAPLQISQPCCPVHITTPGDRVEDLAYYDLNQLMDLATPLLNGLLRLCSECPCGAWGPRATVSVLMNPPQGLENLDPDSETGTAVFDVQIFVHECPLAIAQALGHTVKALNALIECYTNVRGHIAFYLPIVVPVADPPAADPADVAYSPSPSPTPHPLSVLQNTIHPSMSSWMPNAAAV